jgi:catechol 2,3-dioxygenase
VSAILSSWIEDDQCFDVFYEAKIRHVLLPVADLERATNFYHDVMGFRVVFYGPPAGLPSAFLAAGEYYLHLALHTVDYERGRPSRAGHVEQPQLAIAYPDDLSLARAVARLLKFGHAIDAACDHGVTFSVSLRDFDGNELDLYYERPRAHWFASQGQFTQSQPVDVHEWLAEVWSGRSQRPGQKMRAKTTP